MDMEYPLITIGIPVVKDQFLLSAVNCALSQTYSNIEIIILNNASDEQVKNSIRSIVNGLNSDLIYYYENENQLPIIENWNRLLSFANGLFFNLLSDDDKIEKSFISELYNLSCAFPNCNLFHSRILVVNEKEEELRFSPLCNEFEDVFDFIFHRISNFREQFISDFLVRTDAIRKNGGFANLPDAWGSDDLTWYKNACDGGVAYCSKPLFVYRENSFSVTQNMKIKNKIQAHNILFNSISLILKKEGNSLKKKMITDILQLSYDKKDLSILNSDYSKFLIKSKFIKISYDFYNKVRLRIIRRTLFLN